MGRFRSGLPGGAWPQASLSMSRSDAHVPGEDVRINCRDQETQILTFWQRGRGHPRPNEHRRWLSTPEEFVDGETDVACNFSQQSGRYVSASVKGYRGAAAVSMSELLVRFALSDLNKAEPVEQRDDLARP